MKRYLLDTGIASDFINRRLGLPDRVRQAISLGSRVGVCTPVVGELFAGIELSSSRSRNLTRLVHALDSLVVWPFDRLAAEEFGRVFAALRRIGRPMQQIDIQIAAIAMTLGDCTVVTKDSDFAAVPGLNVEDWSVSNST